MKPFETISSAAGELKIAGIDGEILTADGMPADLLPDAAVESEDTVKSSPILRLRPCVAVSVRFTPESFRWLSVRLARHYWHGVWLDCPQESHRSLVPEYAQGACPLCAHLPAYSCCYVPVIVEDGTEWPHYRLLEVDGRLMRRMQDHLTQHRDMAISASLCRGPQGVVFHPAGPSPLTERQLNAAKAHLRPPASVHLHQQLGTLAECIANNLDAEVEEGRLEELEAAMPGALFIPFILGTKMAYLKKWPAIRQECAMKDEWYRRKLRLMNIALACGQRSNDYCTADIDSNEGIQPFIDANPLVKGTQFSSSGNRGGNFEFQIKGPYPSKVVRLFYKQRAGSKIVKPYGEIRCGDCTTTLSGYHPSGSKYTILNLGHIPVITADQLKVPEGVVMQQTITRVNAGAPKRKGRGIDLNKIEGLRRINCGWIGRCPVCAQKDQDTKKEHLIVYRNGAYACINQCDTKEIYQLIKRLGLDNERGVGDETGEALPAATEDLEDEDDE